MWQDFIFTAGSIFGIMALTPTLRDRMATVPLGTSVPSALIGIVYGFTFFTMGMTFSAMGALTTGTLWTCIAALRSPDSAFSDKLGTATAVADRVPAVAAAFDRTPTAASIVDRVTGVAPLPEHVSDAAPVETSDQQGYAPAGD